jgi:hypothetical protein
LKKSIGIFNNNKSAMQPAILRVWGRQGSSESIEILVGHMQQ